MPAFEPRQRVPAGAAKHLSIWRSKRLDSQAAAPQVHGRSGKTGGGQPRIYVVGVKRDEGASKVLDPVPTAIRNLKDQEDSIWPQHASNFRKGAVLQLFGMQVMQHQDGNRRRKDSVREREACDVAANDAAIGTVYP